MALSHDQARSKVCAVCVNEHGFKAVKTVTPLEESLIQKIIPYYSSANILFPAGLCKMCLFGLRQKEKGKEVKFRLPDSYACSPAPVSDSDMTLQSDICQCRWCLLARLSGLKFLQWQQEKKGKSKKKEQIVRLCDKCFTGVVKDSEHTCSSTTQEAVGNLVEALPEQIRSKVAHSILASQMNKAGDTDPVLLTPARGGHPVPVLYNHTEAPTAAIEQLTHSEVFAMRTDAGVSCNAMDTILANMRLKFGRNFVEPGQEEASSLHNSQYREFFTAKQAEFHDKDEKPIAKPFVYCSQYLPFLNMVAKNRGAKLEDKKLLICGDNGKGFFKLVVAIYSEGDEPRVKKSRRTRDEGICGAVMSETGQNMTLLLAVVSFGTLLYCSALHYTALHFTALHCTK